MPGIPSACLQRMPCPYVDAPGHSVPATIGLMGPPTSSAVFAARLSPSVETTVSRTSAFNRYPIRQVKSRSLPLRAVGPSKRPVELFNWLLVEIVGETQTKSRGVVDMPARLRCTAHAARPGFRCIAPSFGSLFLDRFADRMWVIT